MGKRFSKIISIVLVTIIIMCTYVFNVGAAYATEIMEYGGIGGAQDMYEYNPYEVQVFYTKHQTNPDLESSFYIDDYRGYTYYKYDENGNRTNSTSAFGDGQLRVDDTSEFRIFLLCDVGTDKDIELKIKKQETVSDESTYKQYIETYYEKYMNNMILSLVDGLKDNGINVNRDEITYRLILKRPAVSELNLKSMELEINNKDKTIGTQYEQLKTFMTDNLTIKNEIAEDYDVNYAGSIILQTKNNGTYRFAVTSSIDDEGYRRYYYEIVPDFHTNLAYESEPSGTVDTNDTYVVNGNPDVTAIITSRNEEEILKVDGEEVSTTPTSKGWYYIDASNKRKVAKIYKYAEYNGTITEEVKLEGALTHREDTQKPSIRWVYTPEEKKFETDLSYKSDVAGKEENGTYYPQYTINEDSNAKKDLDVTAIITSKTKEEIIKVVVGGKTAELTAENNSPSKANELGWYYPNVNNKTEIAKLYKFDVYDNVNDNGKVKEEVKVIGSLGGEDTETPKIEWTFRRINKTQVTNSDGSTTVTITYNLPVDKESIPDGWSPVYDDDKVTIHAITRVFPKGTKYDEDVTVAQNGNKDKTVTTHVTITAQEGKKEETKKDKSDNLGPQAGAFSFVFAILIAGAVVVAITRYRKMKN